MAVRCCRCREQELTLLGTLSAPLVPYTKAFWGMPSAVDALTRISERAKPTRCFQAGQKAHLHPPLELKQKPIGSGKRSQVTKYPKLFSQTHGGQETYPGSKAPGAAWQGSCSLNSCRSACFLFRLPRHPPSCPILSVPLFHPLLVGNFLSLPCPFNPYLFYCSEYLSFSPSTPRSLLYTTTPFSRAGLPQLWAGTWCRRNPPFTQHTFIEHLLYAK